MFATINFRAIWPISFLGIAGIILILILGFTRPYFRRLPETCNAELSPFSVSVYVNKNLQDKVNVEGVAKRLKAIEVKPEDAVEIIAEINPQPEGCSGTVLVDWELSFVVFSLSVLKTSLETPPSEKLEFTLGSQALDASGEDYVVLTVRDVIGRPVRAVTIPLRGE